MDEGAPVEPVSPELVLVDRATAARARAALPPVTLYEDTLHLRRRLRVAKVARPAPPPPPPAPPRPPAVDAAPVAEPDRPAGSRRRLGRYTALAAAVSVLGGALLIVPRALERTGGGDVTTAAAQTAPLSTAVRTAARTRTAPPGPRHRTTTRASTATRPPPVTTETRPAGSTSGARVPKPPQAGRRHLPDFVWVPHRGAAAYRVEFLRGSRIVLQATTRAPRLHVNPSALPPGRYQWIVWPLDRKGHAGAPVVAASLTVS